MVTYNQVTDVQILQRQRQLDSRRLAKPAAEQQLAVLPTMAFLVRKGNLKNIHEWSDPGAPDVKLIFPN